MIFALAGNQNCGKTTLFNALTGSNQHVGNFPGVTVDQKAGVIKGTDHQVVDLPGIYSIRPYTQEEIVTRDFILKSRPDAIINIVDRHLKNVHADSAGSEKPQAYKYPHVYPKHYVKQRYLPESLGDTTYYEYADNKTEQAAKHYWDLIKGGGE